MEGGERMREREGDSERIGGQREGEREIWGKGEEGRRERKIEEG